MLNQNDIKKLVEDGSYAWEILKRYKKKNPDTYYGKYEIVLNAVGISSNTYDGMNILMLDADGELNPDAVLTLAKACGNTYVIKTHNGWHIYCLRKMEDREWRKWILYAMQNGIEDELHTIISIARKQSILRVHPDFQLKFAVKLDNLKYVASRPHYNLLKRRYGDIVNELYLDDNEFLKFEIYSRHKEMQPLEVV